MLVSTFRWKTDYFLYVPGIQYPSPIASSLRSVNMPTELPLLNKLQFSILLGFKYFVE